MKKNIFIGLAMISFLAVMGINTKMNTTNSSIDITLENIEALGGGSYEYVESGSPGSGVACVCWMSGGNSCCY
jgi:nitrogenase subunit NifH